MSILHVGAKKMQDLIWAQSTEGNHQWRDGRQWRLLQLLNANMRKLVHPFGRSNISRLEVTSCKKPCEFHITQNLANLFYPCKHMFALNSVFNNPYNLQDPQHFAKYSRKISGLLNCTYFFLPMCNHIFAIAWPVT